jgi:hypothetical protein
VDNYSESSSICDIIIGQGRNLLGELGIIMNFNDQPVSLDTETIPMKYRASILKIQKAAFTTLSNTK